MEYKSLNNKWYYSLTPEEQETYRARHNAQLRKRYASDAELRAKKKEEGYQQYWRKRNQAVEYLGGRCSSPTCSWVNLDGSGGCIDPRCLQIDHVKGDGAKLRKENSSERGTSFYHKVLGTVPGEEYQLLCANCNQIKKSTNGELPQARTKDNSYVFVDLRKTRQKDALGRFVTSAGSNG